jgi:magnesium-transporting ATPase (P-type)
MNTKENIEVRLWDYIDGNSSAEEINIIEKLLSDNEEWKEAYKEISNINQMLTSSEMEQPSLRFTKNVMDKISDYNLAPAANYINKKIIWAIGISFIILIGGFLIYAFTKLNWSASSGGNLYFDFKSIDLSRFINSTYMNLFLMASVVLGLMLLDRFLASRKNQSSQHG